MDLHFSLFLLFSAIFHTAFTQKNVTVPHNSPSIVYNPSSNAWNATDSGLDYSKSHVVTDLKGASASLTFTGVAVYYMAASWPYPVSARVVLDGDSGTFVDLRDYGSTQSLEGSASVNASVHWSRTGLQNATHTVVLSLPSNATYAVMDTLIYTIYDGDSDDSSNTDSSNTTSSNTNSSNPTSSNPSSSNTTSSNPNSFNPNSSNTTTSDPNSSKPNSFNTTNSNPDSSKPNSFNTTNSNPDSSNPNSSNTNSSNNDSSNSGTTLPIILGSVLGGVIIIGTVTGAFLVYRCRQKRKAQGPGPIWYTPMLETAPHLDSQDFSRRLVNSTTMLSVGDPETEEAPPPAYTPSMHLHDPVYSIQSR
ncbi:hypothetical protein GYMLUDRAFT_42650 [Collybiopsis luxurians FD-317 M1]|uniref:Mid2 domain-containing protein n=1 Tax=Collybiopsis luxurians FD-317 M1 TaxID=944289 RepID=A0A0D0CYW1_9AGAR|nr:hypothetical protein GYMLUDRAFT_42650 [Collybiopsis luxurians FD-317 M1]